MAQNPMTAMRKLAVHLFDDKGEMAKAVAANIAESVLRRNLQNDAPMTIALAGGETPKPAYRELSKTDLPWHLLEFVATDERLTADPRRSNEKMLRDTLGKKAQVQKLCQNDPAPPLYLALLGMGADGHTASLFAGAMPDADETLIRKVAPAAAEQRLTLPLATLAAAPCLLLMITGEEKWRVLCRPPSPDLPIAQLLARRKNTNTPAEIFCAPD